MIKTIMNVCVKFANDKDFNRANVELLVPKMEINSEMGCPKATRLQLLVDRAQFVLTREHFELIANERGEKINLYSKDPIILKCEVEPYEKYFENGYLMHYFKIKFSESITRCVKFAPHQEKNMKFIKFPFEFNKVQEIDEEAIAMKDGKKCFIQVAYLLSSDDVIEREFCAFDSVRDPSPKYVFSLDEYDMSKDGITHLTLKNGF